MAATVSCPTCGNEYEQSDGLCYDDAKTAIDTLSALRERCGELARALELASRNITGGKGGWTDIGKVRDRLTDMYNGDDGAP